ncbi:hypothetical protein EMIHUDRAFT_202521 [Emiliania huxleyi CCMP1516]|uniref:XPG-I domain-containing protein n=2 Tax=Emiliania huxleyi TaxID=2903 RepID=A0A0D3K8B6_EMIH1|nr:hypothetical protein EMIHUDRAFT_202521 [Emiliania huxleyi CCMP1516]EOD32001.1 hypothetical protein EMIHUDRAFT_202521 [Emiliania huxleyi CCMP1516]|eukprot:XP_005784430.1 hypothetical protein EMIHUDRAFT_202521 [Emiliania huxleyi CCMP1516]
MLRELQRKARRDTETVTEEHLEDAKTLLGLFGVPFLVAPMEAEAQCAALEADGIVDGVDNDVFLFGGRNVYRQLFEPNRNVEHYTMDDVESELSLPRHRLIELAQLLGSDYTDGVHGVGIVNAMEASGERCSSEVVSSFSDLSSFGAWVRAWTPGGGPGTEDERDAGADAGAERRKRFKHRHRNMRQRWAVTEAYLRPTTERYDADACVWGRPDLHGLRSFCLHKFGWQQQKADEQLLPMMRAFEQTQAMDSEAKAPWEARAKADKERLAAEQRAMCAAPRDGATAATGAVGAGQSLYDAGGSSDSDSE